MPSFEDTPLPTNVDRERDMLSGLLSVHDRGMLLGVTATLPDACFSSPQYVAMYRVLKQLAEANTLGPVQFAAAVGDVLTSGRALAAEVLQHYVPVSRHTFEAWASELKTLAHRRRMIGDLYTAMQAAWTMDRHPSEIETELAEQRVRNIADFETRTTDDMPTAIAEFRAFVARLSAAQATGREVRFGIPCIDDRCKWIPSYALWMARTSHGKTAMMANVSLNQVLDGLHPVIFSLEQPRHQMIGRYLSLMLGCSYSTALGAARNTPELADEYDNALTLLQNSGMTILSGVHTVESIFASCMRLKHEGRCDVVYIDQMSRIHHRQSSRENKEQAWTRTSNRLAEIWQELDVPIVLLAQLNTKTGTEHPQPAASHIKDCGSLLEDSCWQLLLDFPQAEPDRFAKIEEKRKKLMAAGRVDIADRIDFRDRICVTCTKDRQAVMGGSGWQERLRFDRSCGKLRD